MAAVFLNLSGNDVFHTIVGDSMISVGGLPDDGAEFNIIYTQASMSLTEIVQIFPTLGNSISYTYFGSGVGQFTLAATAFMDCGGGGLVGLNSLINALNGIKGKPTGVSFGSLAFSAVLINFGVTVVAEPDTMAEISFTFSTFNNTGS